MPLITKISTQKRKNRYNVEIDNEFAFGVNDVLLARENLYQGKELSAAEADRLKEVAEEEKLYEKALRFLSYRPRSERELAQYLKRKTLKSISISISTSSSKSTSPPACGSNSNTPITNLIGRLKKEGYVNDQTFARWWVEQRTKAKVPKGLRLIRQELYQKGVSREVIDSARRDAINRVSTEGDEPNVSKAAHAVISRYKNLEEPVFKRRLSTLLLRRGFEWEEVKRVVDDIAKERYTQDHE